jgi:hypothetical protein
MREIGALEGFFTFNKVGRFFSGAGTAAKAIPGGLLHAAQQAGYASADVTGYAVGQLHEWAGDSSYRVRPQSNFFMQAQEEGLGLTTAKYGLEMVDSAVGRPLRAFVNGKPEEMGETTAQWLLGGVVGKLVKGGAGMAGDAIVGRGRWMGDALANRVEGTLNGQGTVPNLVLGDSKFWIEAEATRVGNIDVIRAQSNQSTFVELPVTMAPGRNSNSAGANFVNETKLVDHFEKHGSEFRAKSAEDYLQIGQDIINNGHEVKYFYEPVGETRTGYVSFMRNSKKTGESLFGFVGTDSNGFITTIHTKPRTELFDLLGDSAQSKLKAFRTDIIGPSPQNGWKYPYQN